MKQEIQEKFIGALMSNNYQKTTILLRDHSGYCALGVLVDLFIQDHPDHKWNVSHVNHFCEETKTMVKYPLYSFCNNVTYLPRIIRLWSGITEHEEQDIMTMNDEGMSFLQIAQEILKKSSGSAESCATI